MKVIPGVLPSSMTSVMKSWLDESKPILTVLMPLYTAKWDTESYPADSTASPKRRCAARKTSNERAT